MPPASRSPLSRARMGLKSSPTRSGSRGTRKTRLNSRLAPAEQFMSSPERLIYMDNQIVWFFRSQGHDQAVAGVPEHIRKFWDPRMRKQIFAHLDSGAAGL